MQKYQTDPADYALELIENGEVTADHMVMACLMAMTPDAIRKMLDDNEMSPRFATDDDEEYEAAIQREEMARHDN